MDGLWRRLKQRKLVQWALAYIAAAFAFIQVLDVVVQRFGWPDRVEQLIILALAIGFFVMLVLAWYHGERGAQRIGGTELVIIALLLAIGGGALWAYTRAPATAAAQPAVAAAKAPSAPTPFNPPADTLVVLPFANLGGDPTQQYFSDGITEELTNALGQNTGLRVIAWDTASKYRNSRQSAGAIAKALDVANVLTGKILRQGNEIRVIVELVDARTGYQAWSHHYDDALSNIFQVQDKISAAIANALKVKFAAANTQRTVNPQAYDLVQQARALINAGLATSEHLNQARALLQRAIALDPGYANAHGLLARTWSDLIGSPTLSLHEGLSRTRAEAARALALDPRNVDALIALGNAEASKGNDAKARTEYERALAIDPSNAVAHSDYGNMLPYKQGLVQYLKAVQLDPETANARSNVALIYMDLGEYRKELAASQALLRVAPHSATAALELAQNYALLHRNEDAVKAFDEVQPDTELGKALVAAGRLAYQSVRDPTLRARALAAADTLYQRHDLDLFSQGDLMQIYLVLGKKGRALKLLATVCKSAPYSCADFPDNPTYNPLRSDPRFKALARKYDAPLPASATSSP